MIRIEHNLNTLIARFQHLKNVGLDQAIEATMKSPRWIAGARQAARKTLMAHAGRNPSLVEAIMQTFVHNATAAGFELGLSGPGGVIESARALMRQVWINDDGQVPHVRRKAAFSLDDAQKKGIEDIREAVRRWVLAPDGKDQREEDIEAEPDEVVNRLMHIMGLEGGRSNWQGIVAPFEPEEETAKRQTLFPTTERRRKPGSGVQETVGTKLAREIQDWIVKNDPSNALAVDPDEVNVLLRMVLVAWVIMVRAELPRMVRWQIRKQWSSAQKELLAVSPA